MSADAIRIVLADDHAVVRAGLKAVLGAARDMTVVGEANDGREAVSVTARLRPDVVVMDLSMPELDGTAATREIVEGDSRARVLVLTMHAEEEYIAPVMEAGASGYLVKTEADRELVNAVRAVAYGDSYLGPTLRRSEVAKATPVLTDQERYELLTQREREVLRLIGQGYSASEIGGRLAISAKTVDTYKQRIHEKLGFTHRSHYVQFALKLGLLAAG